VSQRIVLELLHAIVRNAVSAAPNLPGLPPAATLHRRPRPKATAACKKEHEMARALMVDTAGSVGHCKIFQLHIWKRQETLSMKA
jgi:hypothetical protein